MQLLTCLGRRLTASDTECHERWGFLNQDPKPSFLLRMLSPTMVRLSTLQGDRKEHTQMPGVRRTEEEEACWESWVPQSICRERDGGRAVMETRK